MLFKVYSQQVDVAQPIQMISNDDLEKEIKPLISKAIQEGLVEDEKTATHRALDVFAQVGFISCGDYCIEECDKVPGELPKSCGFSTHIFEQRRNLAPRGVSKNLAKFYFQERLKGGKL